MISYTVDWTTDAEDELTQIWLQTYDPAVSAASDQIDRILARDPIGSGKHLGEGLYKLTVSPLTAYYSVDQAKKTVEVSAVRHTP